MAKRGRSKDGNAIRGVEPALRRWQERADRVHELVSAEIGSVGAPDEALQEFFRPVEASGDVRPSWAVFAALYLIHDWRREPGAPTLAERALGGLIEVGREERKYLENFCRTSPSLYEVVEVEPGRGVRLLDRLRGGAPIRADEPDNATEFEQGSVIAARVVKAGRYRFVQLAADAAPPSLADEACEWLEARFREFATSRRTLDRDAFLRAHPECVAQATLVTLVRHPERVRVDPAEGASLQASPAPKKRSSDANKLYVLDVSLLDSPIEIRRELHISGDRSLEEVHHILQIAMGWQDRHLHAFADTKGRWRCSDVRMEIEGAADERYTTLAEAAPRKGSRFIYTYDFGDDWRHEIRVLERRTLTEDEPRCPAGTGACPPEDCGGPWGYQSMLEALADPTSEDHAEALSWMPDGFDPARFDAGEVNELLLPLSDPAGWA